MNHLIGSKYGLFLKENIFYRKYIELFSFGSQIVEINIETVSIIELFHS